MEGLFSPYSLAITLLPLPDLSFILLVLSSRWYTEEIFTSICQSQPPRSFRPKLRFAATIHYINIRFPMAKAVPALELKGKASQASSHRREYASHAAHIFFLARTIFGAFLLCQLWHWFGQGVDAATDFQLQIQLGFYFNISRTSNDGYCQ
jgi:hypothetical protein